MNVEAKMALLISLGLATYQIPTQATVQMCTDLNHLTAVDQGKMLPDSQITNITMPGIMTCSRACLSKRRCKSFNFNMETEECQLNSKTNGYNLELVEHSDFVFSDISHWPERLLGVCANHTCPLNSYCDPVNTTHHVCNITGCLGSPDVENGHFTTEPEESFTGATLPLVCNKGFKPRGNVVCQNNGAWSSPTCVSVSSCSMVKQYQPDSEDGEYWLRLTDFDSYVTRIYCHNMMTLSPQEFLTLPNINYGIYPMVWNSDCTGESAPLGLACTGQGGEIWYSKINIDINTMNVTQSDMTFANYTNNPKYLDYGNAHDCYVDHPNGELRCGVKGHFTIDLRGTGWRVRDDQQWHIYGWKSMILSIDKEINNTLIELYCGGHKGGCRPTNGLVLVPLPENAQNMPIT